MAGPIVEHAPAKVNLALHVTGQREDGYHLLDTLVVFTEAGDRITVQSAPGDSFSIGGPFADALQGESDNNLVLRARDLLREHAADGAPVSILLEKNLPIASGIGGGSSDAAATLRALTRLWSLRVPEERMTEIALLLGADVPMCLEARTSIASGIGDVLDDVSGLPPLALVLVNPGVAVPTPAVFRALESRENPPLPTVPTQSSFSRFADWLGRETRNDLETPARSIAPQISDALSALRTHGAALARMSGSGATCFGLFASGQDAARTASSIAMVEPSWYVTATNTIEKAAADVAH